jgi:signal transduction histidine kinase/ligand-binding sensor domain-containing protein
MILRWVHNATHLTLGVASGMALAFCSFLSATAQSSSLDVSQYLATHWRAQDGYFQGNIQVLAQNNDGYIWLGTGYGLLRFDGVRFTEWKQTADGSLPGRPIQALLASKDGSLWIGGIGLSELRDGVMHRYHELDGFSIDALAEEVDGSIWIGVQPKQGQPALCRVQSRKPKCFPGSPYPQGWIRSLFVDASGRSWAGAEDGLWQIGPGQPTFVAKTGSVVSNINQAPDGTLLLASDSELNSIVGPGVVKRYALPLQTKPVSAVRLLRSADGALWIGTLSEGILHEHDGRVDNYTTQDGLPAPSITAILQDREGNIWVAAGSSISRFRRPAVATVTTRQGLANEQVLTVLSNEDGSTWVGTLAGLNRLEGSTVTTPRIKLPSNTVTSLFRTNDGKLLVATNLRNGMVWLDHNRVVPLKVPSGENVFGITSGSRGEIWVDNRESGLQRLSATGELLQGWPWSAAGISGVSLGYDSKHDGIWLGGARGDLALFKDGKIVERYGTLAGLGDGAIRDIRVSGDGSVWAASRKGLVRLLNGRVSTLNSSNGLPCDGVHWMRHGGDGSVWLYTECGLVQLSAADLDMWVSDSSHRVSIMRWLTNLDGVENIVFGDWYTPQAAETKDGRILFAMTSGLGVIDGRSGMKNELPPPVKIETVTADGQNVEIQSESLLPKRMKKVQFAFTALSYSSPQQIRFRYQLEGFDSGFTDPGMLRAAEYTNLPPGHYRFHVIASNNDGVWNNVGATLSIYIPPAFVQTFTFKVLVATLLVCALFAFYHYRTNYLLRQTKERFFERMSERERTARDLHDTFFQGIQGLLLRFHTGATALPRDEPLRLVFEEILVQSDQLMLEGRELVLDLRTRLADDEELAQALAHACEQLKAQHPIDYTVSVLGKAVTIQVAIKEELFIIGKEALTNAFQHSKATKIEVELAFSSASISLSVRDDGCGVGSAVEESGSRAGHFGLPGMRERARHMGASFELWSQSNAGTEIEVHVPALLASPSKNRLWAWLSR